MKSQDRNSPRLSATNRNAIGKRHKNTKQVTELRDLCRLMVENQEIFLRFISDKLDEIEAGLSGTDADTVSPNNE